MGGVSALLINEEYNEHIAFSDGFGIQIFNFSLKNKSNTYKYVNNIL